ncbi:transketolase [candidate division KSB1 bacterium]|nr:transketolase [candidate division KSB1 bacterium]
MKELKPDHELAQLCVNTIKMLAIEGVQKAKSGHPGMPMGMADVAFVLWSQFLNFNPTQPDWPNRDRFLLSAGHGSMLLYSLLHLFGYDLPLEELKNFRQWESKTPGHPEYGLTSGVETSTGPLGQGFSNGVGMAIAQKMMEARFNSPGNEIINHKIFAIVSDGDLMEGVASEAASLAGHLKLGNIIYLYDNNHISIEGNTSLAFTEDVAKRFEAYGWHTIAIDGHDHVAITSAIKSGIAETHKPTLILARTEIAKGSPTMEGSHEAHGAPLGDEEIARFKQKIGWPDEKFYIPEKVKNYLSELIESKKAHYKAWTAKFQKWQQENPEKFDLWQKMQGKVLPAGIDEAIMNAVGTDAAATRALSGKAIQKIAELVPSLCGGSADLAPSNNTHIKNATDINHDNFLGRNFHFGVREHAMGAVLNGLALYGGIIPYGGTFMVFSDYMRPTVRLAALMGLQVVYIFTHDSIFVGEDGPTHQPVEHLAALQVIPNLTVFRPADNLETAAAWIFALKHRNGPTALCLTRQKVPVVHKKDTFKSEDMARGCFVIEDVKNPQIVLIGSGSELGVVIDAGKLLKEKGYAVRIVSMPSLTLFKKQPIEYQNTIIPPTGTKLVAVEAGVSIIWANVVGKDGLIIGLDQFGSSAPYQILAEKFGFTGSQVAAKVVEWLKSSK